MKRSVIISLVCLAAVLFLFAGCGTKDDASGAVAAAPVSDGSEDLKIDFQVNLAQDDPDSHFTFSGNVRYMLADNDRFDAVSGASALRSTEVFMMYLYDVEGKATMSSGLRGLFLFGVNPYEQVVGDDLNAYKASDGSIVIQYAHRGTAYRIATDTNGTLSLPDGVFDRRIIGYIASGAPQVISPDFSADGTAETVDWDKVWDPKTADGKEIGDSGKKTGSIERYADSSASMYYWDGDLDVSLNGDVLKITGFLTAVKR